MSHEKRAYEHVVKAQIEHAKKSGKPITQREAEKAVRPIVERADRERSERGK